jgi:hypothetical protein
MMTLGKILLAALPAALLAQPAQIYEFYHGSDYKSAEWISKNRLSPMTSAELGETPFIQGAPWEKYTDFGQGFYTHPRTQYELAKSWAMRAARSKCSPGQKESMWGIVAFLVDAYDLALIRRGSPKRVLQFTNKADRPDNAPSRSPGYGKMSWIEFIEFNRHLHPEIHKPDDRNWSADYMWIQGPIWVPRDSGIDSGLPPFDKESQINWLAEGLDRVLNNDKYRRRLDSGTTPCPDDRKK